MSDNEKGSGIGSAAGVAATTAVGTTGVALASGAIAQSERTIKKLTTQIHGADGVKGLKTVFGEETAKAIKSLSGEEKVMLKILGVNKFSPSRIMDTLENAKNVLAGTDAKAVKSLEAIAAKIAPAVGHQSAYINAGQKLASAEKFREVWQNGKFVERLTKSVQRAPKQLAFIAAPLIAAGAYFGIHHLTSGRSAEVNGNGPAR